jgi:hypothetical protein
MVGDSMAGGGCDGVKLLAKRTPRLKAALSADQQTTTIIF